MFASPVLLLPLSYHKTPSRTRKEIPQFAGFLLAISTKEVYNSGQESAELTDFQEGSP
jgi:hypothetical protein